MTESPWNGKLTPAHDTKKSFMMTPPSFKSSHNIVNRVKAAIDNDDNLKRADELKKMIDNPIIFQGGREWSSTEKEKLKQAENDYREIQSAKKDSITSLDKIDSLLNEQSLEYKKLSGAINLITATLKEIDSHLLEYEEKIKLLDEKGDNITDEEKAWLIAAHKQIDKLTSEKEGLSNSLIEARSLQTELSNTENTITKDLEKLLGSSRCTSTVGYGLQSADAIIQEMAEIKADFSQFNSVTRSICDVASKLFSTIFDGIKNISSKITSQLKATTDILVESNNLLGNYPEPNIQHQL